MNSLLRRFGGLGLTNPWLRRLGGLSLANPWFRRLGGLGLVVLSVGPVIVVVAGIAVALMLCVGAVRAVTDKVGGIVAIVGNEIVPQVRKVQASYASLAAQAGRMKSELDNAMAAVTKIQDLSIRQGQFGSTGSVAIRIPDHDLSLASGAVKISDGQFVDKSLPAVQIPPAPVSVPLAPLRAVFAPFGPEGPVGQAIGASQRGLETAVGEVTKLQQPLQEIQTAVADGLAPLQATVAILAWIFLAAFVALVLLLAIYIAAGVLLAVRSPAEASRAFGTGGASGYVFFVYRTLLSNGMSRLLGRTPPLSPERAIAELEETVARLERELAPLRAELAGRQAAAT